MNKKRGQCEVDEACADCGNAAAEENLLVLEQMKAQDLLSVKKEKCIEACKKLKCN